MPVNQGEQRVARGMLRRKRGRACYGRVAIHANGLQTSIDLRIARKSLRQQKKRTGYGVQRCQMALAGLDPVSAGADQCRLISGQDQVLRDGAMQRQRGGGVLPLCFAPRRGN